MSCPNLLGRAVLLLWERSSSQTTSARLRAGRAFRNRGDRFCESLTDTFKSLHQLLSLSIARKVTYFAISFPVLLVCLVSTVTIGICMYKHLDCYSNLYTTVQAWNIHAFSRNTSSPIKADFSLSSSIVPSLSPFLLSRAPLGVLIRSQPTTRGSYPHRCMLF